MLTIKQQIRKRVNVFGFDILRWHDSPEQTLLGLHSKNINTVIDVGANVGQFARMISGFFPQAKLYCFEPLEGPFQKLSAWAHTENGRVRCFQLALGDRIGEAEMHFHEQHTPSSSLLASTDTVHRLYPQTQAEHLTKIRLSTLDHEFENDLDRMQREILLKLDVQGFEYRVLRGGVHVLSKCYAVLLEVCLIPLYEGQADFKELVMLLTQHGLHYAGNLDQVYGEDGRVIYFDVLFIRP